MRSYGLTVPGSDHRFCVPTVSQVFFRPNRPINRIAFPKATLKNDGFVVDLSFYDLLGIPESGSVTEIKNAYKQLARKYHPDVSPPGRVEEYTKRFIQVQEAYETLSDPSRRAMYDKDLKRRDPEGESQCLCIYGTFVGCKARHGGCGGTKVGKRGCN